jgi:hypothetical protein
LKERVFGLTGSKGNHGEDVKEYYFYLDSTPTQQETEFELIDTGVFDEDRYFDVFVEYAKADVEDLLIRINLVNRGPDTAELHLLPTLWFRNTWS